VLATVSSITEVLTSMPFRSLIPPLAALTSRVIAFITLSLPQDLLRYLSASLPSGGPCFLRPQSSRHIELQGSSFPQPALGAARQPGSLKPRAWLCSPATAWKSLPGTAGAKRTTLALWPIPIDPPCCGSAARARHWHRGSGANKSAVHHRP